MQNYLEGAVELLGKSSERDKRSEIRILANS